jgi:hypothetical protein
MEAGRYVLVRRAPEGRAMTVVAIKQAPADLRPMPASADAEGAL